jgi:hypothetical protein
LRNLRIVPGDGLVGGVMLLVGEVLPLHVIEIDSEKNKLVEGWKGEVVVGDGLKFVIRNV